MKLKLFLLILFCLLFSCTVSPKKEDPKNKKTPEKKGFNFLVLQFTEDELKEIQSVLPFYTYEWNKKKKSEDLRIWPLISGFKQQKDRFYWFSFPLLTQNLTIQDSQRSIRHFLSIPLFTRYETYDVKDQFSFQRFDSLPLMTSFFSQIRQEKKEKFFSLGTPFFQTWDYEQRASKTRLSGWKIAPTILSEDNDFFLLKKQNWGDETDFSFLEFTDLSLFRYERYKGRYPGSKYYFSPAQYMSLSSEETLIQFPEKDGKLKRKISLLKPLFSLELEEEELQRFDFLPLVSYESNKEEGWKFNLVPFLLTLSSKNIVEFTPKKSLENFFPFSYLDQGRNQWSFLSPLMRYRRDLQREETQFRFRGLFHYNQTSKKTNIDLGEGVLFSYHSDLNYERWSLLSGLLFSRSIEPDGKYIEIFFLKIKTGGL